ncbi:MAG: protein TolR [Blastomonas sp.]
MGMSVGSGSGTGRRGRRSRAPMAEINVTPFVDVMLVLLIIFMVTAPLLTAGVPVELPESRANALEQEREPVQISVNAEGLVFVDDEQVARADIPARFMAIRQQGGDKPPQVMLRADTSLDYGKVMAVMGELNRAGLNSVSLVTTGSSRRD